MKEHKNVNLWNWVWGKRVQVRTCKILIFLNTSWNQNKKTKMKHWKQLESSRFPKPNKFSLLAEYLFIDSTLLNVRYKFNEVSGSSGAENFELTQNFT